MLAIHAGRPSRQRGLTVAVDAGPVFERSGLQVWTAPRQSPCGQNSRLQQRQQQQQQRQRERTPGRATRRRRLCALRSAHAAPSRRPGGYVQGRGAGWVVDGGGDKLPNFFCEKKKPEHPECGHRESARAARRAGRLRRRACTQRRRVARRVENLRGWERLRGGSRSPALGEPDAGLEDGGDPAWTLRRALARTAGAPRAHRGRTRRRPWSPPGRALGTPTAAGFGARVRAPGAGAPARAATTDARGERSCGGGEGAALCHVRGAGGSTMSGERGGAALAHAPRAGGVAFLRRGGQLLGSQPFSSRASSFLVRWRV